MARIFSVQAMVSLKLVTHPELRAFTKRPIRLARVCLKSGSDIFVGGKGNRPFFELDTVDFPQELVQGPLEKTWKHNERHKQATEIMRSIKTLAPKLTPFLHLFDHILSVGG